MRRITSEHMTINKQRQDNHLCKMRVNQDVAIYRQVQVNSQIDGGEKRKRDVHYLE